MQPAYKEIEITHSHLLGAFACLEEASTGGLGSTQREKLIEMKKRSFLRLIFTGGGRDDLAPHSC